MKRNKILPFFAFLCVAVLAVGAKPPVPEIPLPVLHFAFPRNVAGERVRDLSGRRNDGWISGKPEFVEGVGQKGKALRFDGRGTYIRVPRSASLEPEAITVAVWLRIGTDPVRNEPSVIVFKRNTSYHDNEDYALQLFPNHVLRIDVASPRLGHRKVDSSVALAPDLWHHAAMSIDRDGARLYLDGELVGECRFPCVLDHDTGTDLLVGARDHAALPTTWFGNYDLADLQIWGEALDGKQVARLYRRNARLPGVARPESNSPPLVPTERPGGGVGNPRVFPAWIDPTAKPAPDETRLLSELRELLAQGRRDRAASPEYLDALQRLVERHSVEGCRNGFVCGNP